jgi:flagellar biogenesis protein FliO
MTRETTPDELSEEFASTFQEWHYLVGGGAVGFLLGVVVALWVVVRLFRAEQESNRPRRRLDGEEWIA